MPDPTNTDNTDPVVEATSAAGRREERFSYILQKARKGRYVSLREITERFGVNIQTARRDVAMLESHSLVTKVHGGAIPREEPDALSVQERLGVQDVEKRRLALLAASFIQEDEVIFLDGGSTISRLAPLLVDKRLHVVTNAVSIANILKDGRPNLDVVITGGTYYPRSELVLGPLALQAVRQMRFHKAFFSAAGVTADGVFNANMLVVELEQAVMAQTAETYLLADSSKIERTSLMRICGWDAIHTLLAAGPIPARLAGAAGRAGCRICHSDHPQ